MSASKTPARSLLQRIGHALAGVPVRQLAADLSIRNIPTVWVFGLTISDSALTVLNQTTFGLPAAWKTLVTLALGLFAWLGIGPVLGPRFKAYVHLPARIAGAISMVLLGIEVLIQQDTSLPYSAILLGVIQFAGGLGFAPAYVPTA